MKYKWGSGVSIDLLRCPRGEALANARLGGGVAVGDIGGGKSIDHGGISLYPSPQFVLAASWQP
jgi:hypothetical protein